MSASGDGILRSEGGRALVSSAARSTCSFPFWIMGASAAVGVAGLTSRSSAIPRMNRFRCPGERVKVCYFASICLRPTKVATCTCTCTLGI